MNLYVQAFSVRRAKMKFYSTLEKFATPSTDNIMIHWWLSTHPSFLPCTEVFIVGTINLKKRKRKYSILRKNKQKFSLLTIFNLFKNCAAHIHTEMTKWTNEKFRKEKKARKLSRPCSFVIIVIKQCYFFRKKKKEIKKRKR